MTNNIGFGYGYNPNLYNKNTNVGAGADDQLIAKALGQGSGADSQLYSAGPGLGSGMDADLFSADSANAYSPVQPSAMSFGNSFNTPATSNAAAGNTGNEYSPIQQPAPNFSEGIISQMSEAELENLTKYATGTPITPVDDGGPFAGMGLMLGISGGMSALQGGKWLWNNRQDLSGGWAKNKAASLAQYNKLQTAGGLMSKGGYQYLVNTQNAKSVIEAIPSAKKLANLTEAAKASDKATKALKNYESARKAAEYAMASPQNAKRALYVANRRLANARALAHGQIPAKGFFGKTGSFISKATGYSKASGAIKTFATKSPLTAKLLKCGKGNGAFLAITGGIELFTQVIPTFSQLGAKKGAKQAVKSTVKVGASIGGWIAGAKAGALAGAAIGSFFPGLGNVVGGLIGAACGLIGGCVGSWLAGKAADKVCGKNELDKAKEAQAKQIARQAKTDKAAMQEIAAAAAQRLQAEGPDSADAKIAFGSLKKIQSSQTAQTTTSNPYTTNTQAQNAYTSNPYTTNATPSFQGLNQQYNYNQNSFGQNLYAQNQFQGNPFMTAMGNQKFNQNPMDMDFMAMGAGLI